MKTAIMFIWLLGLCIAFTAVAWATTYTVTDGRWDRAGGGCYDWIRVTRDDNGCYKMITRDCDNSDPCGWVDRGWACDGGEIWPVNSGEQLSANLDNNGNLICSVAPGLGGVYSPSSSGGICFAANGGTYWIISAAVLTGLT
ncbi:MAG TPA: hypothetical protein VHI13_13635 [Candidatus Kapabacteria bacterium]|nr:hypothetical protein [Candidatus Kapabacteria bacterium]